MTNILAILKKQLKDTFKNKEILIQFIMFPAIAIIMENAINIEGMPERFFVTLFATMYIGMAPLTSMAAIIAEEKEKNTLRVLMLSNVKPAEYLMGTGSYIWLICMLGAVVFAVTGKYEGKAFWVFLAIMAVGILASLLIGAMVGTFSRNQMMATSITVPVMMVFAFLPMLSMFNETIAKVAKFTYSQQISLLISQVENLKLESMNVVVIAFNVIVAAVLFGYAYKRSGLA